MRYAVGAILATWLLLGTLAAADAGTVYQDKIEPDLAELIEASGPTETFIVWIHFEDRPEFDTDPGDGLPPVNQDYVDGVASITGVEARHVDELLNALSVEATRQAIYEIAALHFVMFIDAVPVGCALPEGCDDFDRLPAGIEGPLNPPTLAILVFVVGAVAGLASMLLLRNSNGKTRG